MATLAEIRAKLKAQDAKTSSGGPIGDNAIYPHWNIAEGTEAVSYTHLTLPTRS